MVRQQPTCLGSLSPLRGPDWSGSTTTGELRPVSCWEGLSVSDIVSVRIERQDSGFPHERTPMTSNSHLQESFVGRYEDDPEGQFRAELPPHNPDRLFGILTTLFFCWGLGLCFLGLSFVYGDVEASGVSKYESFSTSSQREIGIIFLVMGIPLAMLFGIKRTEAHLLEVSDRAMRVGTVGGESHLWPLKEVVIQSDNRRLSLSKGDDSLWVAIHYPQEELDFLRETIERRRSESPASS